MVTQFIARHQSIHAYVIDYPFAIVLIAAPLVLKPARANRSQCGFRLLSASPRCSCPP